MSNTINTTKARILLKTANTAEWQESNLTPLLGEMCIYTDHYTKGEGNNAISYPGIKIGDGNKNINQLPFITGDHPSTDDFEALKAFFTITDSSATFNGTATKATNVTTTSKTSSTTSIYIVGSSSSGTTAASGLNKTATAHIYNYYVNNTSSSGYTRLTLGNSTKIGNAGNSYGSIKLFSPYAAAIELKTDTGTSSDNTTYSLKLPLKNGTIALISDLSNYLTNSTFNSHLTGDFKTISETVAAHTTFINTVPNTYATKSALESAISAIVGGATVDELNTLKELSEALGNDENFATTINNSIAKKVDKTTYQAKVDNLDGSIITINNNISSIQTSLNGKAPTSHASTTTTYGISTASAYGHAMASSTSPKANGTAAVGNETAKFARGDHVHPLQTTVSGNAGSANKVNSNLVIKLNSGSTEGTNLFTFNGSAAKTINITAASINAMAIDCTIDCGTWS